MYIVDDDQMNEAKGGQYCPPTRDNETSGHDEEEGV